MGFGNPFDDPGTENAFWVMITGICIIMILVGLGIGALLFK